MHKDICSKQQKGTEALRMPLPELAESSFFAEGHELIVFTDAALEETTGLKIAFTTRKGGVSKAPYRGLNLSYCVGDAEADVFANRGLLLKAMNANAYASQLISPLQVHGIDIVVVDDVENAQRIAQNGADGVICTEENIPVLLCFADCVPLILAAPDGSFAVLHAGWRGALGNIPALGLEALAYATGCMSTEINCYIGAHIGACCYEVDSSLLQSFVEALGPSCNAGDGRLDLDAAVCASLVKGGANSERIARTDVCTSCHTDMFYSYRKDDGITGRHGAFAIKSEGL